MKVIAFVPIRGGSKSIPRKNIIDFAGMPLAYWALKALQDSVVINDIIVAYDDEYLIDELSKFPLSKVTYYKRDANNATDTSSTESVMLEYLEKHKLEKDDIFILVQATNPFLKSNDIENAFHIYGNNKFQGSLLSVVNSKRFYWEKKSFPINYNPLNRPRRQDFEGLFVENGSFYMNKVENILLSKSRLTEPFETYEMEEYSFHEIDEPLDLKICEIIFREKVLDTELKMNTNYKAIFSDVDGVLTDGSMYYTEFGDEMKRFSTYDGIGFNLFSEKGLITGLITTEDVKLTKRRAEKLKINYCITNVSGIGKLESCKKICYELGIDLSEVIYIGDEINCYELLTKVGLAACPSNANEKIKKIPGILKLKKSGGTGVIKELFELIYS
jgi:YrbI family 3-deoxy-D-manno-octulosonate 8-phosphate phosphatase